MSSSDAPSGSESDPIEEAATSLQAAIARVSQRLESLRQQVEMAHEEADAVHGTDEDRSRLADSLDASLAREQELEAAVETAAKAVEDALAVLGEAPDSNGEGKISE